MTCSHSVFSGESRLFSLFRSMLSTDGHLRTGKLSGTSRTRCVWSLVAVSLEEGVYVRRCKRVMSETRVRYRQIMIINADMQSTFLCTNRVLRLLFSVGRWVRRCALGLTIRRGSRLPCIYWEDWIRILPYPPIPSHACPGPTACSFKPRAISLGRKKDSIICDK